MDSNFAQFFPDDLFGKEYYNQEEYIYDFVKRAEMMMMYYIGCLPESDAINRYRGIAVNKEQAYNTFNENKDIKTVRKNAIDEFSKALFFIQSRIKGYDKSNFFAFEYIRTTYRLTDFECFCVILSMMPFLDNKYGKIFAYLQDDVNKFVPEYDLAFKLYYFFNDLSDIHNFFSRKAEVEGKLSSLCFENGTMNIDKRLLSFILSNGKKDISENGTTCIVPENDEPLPIMEETAQKIANVIKGNIQSETVYFSLTGVKGAGKKTQVKRFGEIMKISMVMVDVAEIYLKDDRDFYNALLTCCRESIINQGALCFYNFQVFEEENCTNARYEEVILNVASQFSNVVFIVSDSEKKLNRKNNYVWLDVHIDYPTKQESIKLWEICLSGIEQSDNVQAFEMANKFTFSPGQIVGTKQQADRMLMWNQGKSLSKGDICNCAYSQIVHDLEKQASLIYAKYNWDELVLPDKEKDMLMNACDQIKYKHVVYDNWGFEKRLAYGKGVSMLFAGPPGTGKTMAARVVAKELGIEIYKVNLSQIVSKYIGETEKNLNVLFDEAKKSNVILFFDETDALLGKRTEVKDSHDKNANMETSYLLQKMEEYDGITVMTTNYLENIDSAFFRRITYVIHFPFPEIPSRKKIWQNMFPKEMPMSKDIDFDYLANQFELAGGNIKNIAVTAAFLAAKEDKQLHMKHILKAIKYELTKQGKTLIKEDFGEHGYLLDQI